MNRPVAAGTYGEEFPRPRGKTMSTSHSAPVLDTDSDAVLGVIREVGQAWAAGDADAFAALYSLGATVVLPGGVYLTGREAIRAYMTAGFAGPMKGSTTSN